MQVEEKLIPGRKTGARPSGEKTQIAQDAEQLGVRVGSVKETGGVGRGKGLLQSAVQGPDAWQPHPHLGACWKAGSRDSTQTHCLCVCVLTTLPPRWFPSSESVTNTGLHQEMSGRSGRGISTSSTLESPERFSLSQYLRGQSGAPLFYTFVIHSANDH